MSKRDRTAPSSGLPGGGDHREVMEVAAGVFKNTCLQLLDRVRDGSVEVIVTKRGEPVARLVSAGGSVPSAFGFMRGTITGRGDIVAPDRDAWGELG